MPRALAAFALLLVVCVSPVGAAQASHADVGAGRSNATDGSPPCAGRITRPAGGVTIVSVQGARFGKRAEKTPARLLAFGPRGRLKWVYRAGRKHNLVWAYDVDPLPNGNVFVTATKRNATVLFELDPQTGTRRWTETLPFDDTHDADLLDERHIVIANMRNYDPKSGVNGDRVVIYNRTSDRIEWQWRFSDHYDRSVGGNYTTDWTHLNDVDAVGDGEFLLSPRNFDQVILVNRTTGRIDLRLGKNGHYGTLNHQHNPDYLESDAGRPTFLVADSDNNRVVEYEHGPSGWNRTWTAGNNSTLAWPRDADRLPNGDTLIADSRNNRVIEVTPAGNVVWEVYGPWLVYDAERLPGGGSRGPTAADMNASNAAALSNASPPNASAVERCDAAIDHFRGSFDAPNRTAGTRTGSARSAGGSASSLLPDVAGQAGGGSGNAGAAASGPGSTATAADSTTAVAGRGGFLRAAAVGVVLVVVLAVVLERRRRR